MGTECDVDDSSRAVIAAVVGNNWGVRPTRVRYACNYRRLAESWLSRERSGHQPKKVVDLIDMSFGTIYVEIAPTSNCKWYDISFLCWSASHPSTQWDRSLFCDAHTTCQR